MNLIKRYNKIIQWFRRDRIESISTKEYTKSMNKMIKRHKDTLDKLR